jgi:hypothetical protein
MTDGDFSERERELIEMARKVSPPELVDLVDVLQHSYACYGMELGLAHCTAPAS